MLFKSPTPFLVSFFILLSPVVVSADIGSISSNTISSYRTSGTTNHNNHENSGNGFLQDLGTGLSGEMESVTVHITERGSNSSLQFIIRQCDDVAYSVNCVQAFQELWYFTGFDQPYTYNLGEGYAQEKLGVKTYDQSFTFFPDKYYYVLFTDNTTIAGTRAQTSSTEDIYPAGGCARNCGSAVDMAFIFRGSVSIDVSEPEPTCCSSVLFLPGIQASRLYSSSFLGENRLWEPNFFFDDHDVLELVMDQNGESVKDVYTRDPLLYINDASDQPVYGGFINFLDGLETDGTITDYATYAYDWRYDVVDIVNNGTKYENEVRYIIETLEALASSSRTGRVTIIGHSNGGLLGKALIAKLESEGKSHLVDDLIMIGSPQLGTPKAITSLLHGQDQGIRAIRDFIPVVTEEAAREVSANMPGAYGLLPGQAYYDASNDIVVRFKSGTSTQQFINTYGSTIDSESELNAFLLDNGNGRDDVDGLDEALVLNAQVLNRVRDTRQALDDWQTPVGIGVYSIIGTGRNTVSGVEYEPIQEKKCSLFRCSMVDIYKPIPIISQQGDQTVMVQSAEGRDSLSAERWYVDLTALQQVTSESITHVNFTEATPVQVLIQDILTSTNTVFDSYVSSIAPNYPGQQVMLGTHSPVYLYVEDEGGRRSGQLSETEFFDEIPEVDFISVGGSSYIIAPEDLKYSAHINGYATGSVAITTHDLTSTDQTLRSKALVPDINENSVVTMEYSNNQFTNIKVDEDGDGEIDLELTPDGEVVAEPEELTTAELISLLSNYINTNVTNKGAKKTLKNRLKSIQKLYSSLEKVKNKHSFLAKPFSQNRLITMLVASIEKQVRVYERLEKVDGEVAVEIKRLLQLIKSSL